MARGMRHNCIVVPRSKAGRDRFLESADSVAAVARLRDPGNRVAVSPRQCMANRYPRFLRWLCAF